MSSTELANQNTSATNKRKFAKQPIISELTKTLITSNSEVEDSVFDCLLPEFYQSASAVHWTPIKAIKHIADFISDCDENSKFLDIGSGCGKLCIVLSLLSKINIYGIEQRADMYKVAQKIKSTNNLQNVHFIRGNMLDIDWSEFDIYYLYNPFQEHITDFDDLRIDDRIEIDKKYYAIYTNEVYRQLCEARPGKKLITFYGYGGLMPDTWKLSQSCVIKYGDLCMWEKIK